MLSATGSWRRRGSNGRFVASKPLDVQPAGEGPSKRTSPCGCGGSTVAVGTTIWTEPLGTSPRRALSINWSRLTLRFARHPVLWICPGSARIPMAPISSRVKDRRRQNACWRSRVGDTITTHRHHSPSRRRMRSRLPGHLRRPAGAGAATNESERPPASTNENPPV
jgi:hypothetical protein